MRKLTRAQKLVNKVQELEFKLVQENRSRLAAENNHNIVWDLANTLIEVTQGVLKIIYTSEGGIMQALSREELEEVVLAQAEIVQMKTTLKING